MSLLSLVLSISHGSAHGFPHSIVRQVLTYDEEKKCQVQWFVPVISATREVEDHPLRLVQAKA
jgi:hypothetical protein